MRLIRFLVGVAILASVLTGCGSSGASSDAVTLVLADESVPDASGLSHADAYMSRVDELCTRTSTRFDSLDEVGLLGEGESEFARMNRLADLFDEFGLGLRALKPPAALARDLERVVAASEKAARLERQVAMAYADGGETKAKPLDDQFNTALDQFQSLGEAAEGFSTCAVFL